MSGDAHSKPLHPPIRLGVVSFLNAKPLIAGLEDDPDVSLAFDVPSALPVALEGNAVDAALVPIVDVLRSDARYVPVSDACIGCDGQTMTVRVFSQVPPDRVTRLAVDPDSHTSVALARVLWHELHERSVELVPLDTRTLADEEAVLLIGDKVIDPRRRQFAYEVDLGGAWRQHTGLPFVFAVWATRADPARPGIDRALLARKLAAARDRGTQQARQLAAIHGPGAGWPIELAKQYLADCLKYRLDDRAIEGVRRFARSAAEIGLLPRDAAVAWPFHAAYPQVELAP